VIRHDLSAARPRLTLRRLIICNLLVLHRFHSLATSKNDVPTTSHRRWSALAITIVAICNLGNLAACIAAAAFNGKMCAHRRPFPSLVPPSAPPPPPPPPCRYDAYRANAGNVAETDIRDLDRRFYTAWRVQCWTEAVALMVTVAFYCTYATRLSRFFNM
jgi:hypothetical protein